MLNTDTMDSVRLNKLRRDAKSEFGRALFHALRCGVVTFDQADRIAAILKEGK